MLPCPSPLHTASKRGALAKRSCSCVPLAKRERGAVLTAAYADEASSSSRGAWDGATSFLVSCASIPFSILVLPQVVQNQACINAGSTSALAVISWEGYLACLLGNTLMFSHFANEGEWSAVTVQLVGIANNLLVLLQMAWVSCMPRTVFVAAAASVAVAVAMSLARLSGRIPAGSSQPGQLGVWQWWQLVSGVFGMAVVPQVLYNILNPTHPSFLPGLVALTLCAGWYAVPAHRSSTPAPGMLSVAKLPGWASTLLFGLSPLPQLVRNFLDPRSLEGLSVGTMLLALLGNALMAPRALFVQDPVWLIGATWACVAGWGQLLSMFLRKASATGLHYVDPTLFAAVTAVLLAYLAFVLAKDAAAKGLLFGRNWVKGEGK